MIKSIYENNQCSPHRNLNVLEKITIYFDFVTQFSFEIGGNAIDRYCTVTFERFFQIR